MVREVQFLAFVIIDGYLETTHTLEATFHPNTGTKQCSCFSVSVPEVASLAICVCFSVLYLFLCLYLYYISYSGQYIIRISIYCTK